MRPSYQLTAHPVGSLREIWAVSWPLMLSLSSTSLMNFADRLYLAHYSLSAMNAVVSAGALCFAVMALPLTICEITGVFVGRFHGQEQLEKTGRPVWQMIWLALLFWPIFVLINRLISPLLFTAGSDEAAYFVTSLDFGPLQLCCYALTGFFLGLGKTKIIALSALSANLLNALLAPLLIFGTPLSPSMGVQGAAIATGLAQGFHAVLLLGLFLQKNLRMRYSTSSWRFDTALAKEMLFVGFPAGLGRAIESAAHGLFFRIIAMAGALELTCASIAQSFYLLVVFCVYGISKGVTAIVSNLVGANAHSEIPRAIHSAFKVHSILFCLLLFFSFTSTETILSKTIGADDIHLLSHPEFLSTVKSTLFCMSLFFLIKGFSWILVGHLTALGDTRFIMLVNASTHWIGFIIPIYFVVNFLGAGAIAGWTIIAINSLLVFSIFWWRSTKYAERVPNVYI